MPTIGSEVRGNTLIVTVSSDLGEFDSSSIDSEGQAILRRLDDSQLHNVVMDLSGTDYYGSSALNLFLKIEKKTQANGGQFILVGLSPHEMEILHVTKLDSRWTVCKNVNEALAAAGCNISEDSLLET